MNKSKVKLNCELEDIARAWASIDGKLVEFERGKIDPEFEDIQGHYEGYLLDAEELILRTIKFFHARVIPSEESSGQ